MKDLACRLDAYIRKHPFDPGKSDCESVLEQLYQTYAESHESDPAEIGNGFQELEELLTGLPLKDNNAVFNLCCRLCSAYERKAFLDGLQYGAHLISELRGGVGMDSRNENRRLIEQYPFLLPWGTDSANFESTELDTMPTGWRIAFGEELCKEIMEELTRNSCVDSYRIVQIKEKHGALRWYAQGGTERIHREIVPKYEKLSKRICIQCGRPATLVSLDWTAPWCDVCAEKLGCQECVDIDDFYG